MSKSFTYILFGVFVLILYLLVNFSTFIFILCVFFVCVKSILIWTENQLNSSRKPGTVSHSKLHLIEKRSFKTKSSCKPVNTTVNKSESRNPVVYRIKSSSNKKLKVFKSCQTDLSVCSFDSGIYSRSSQTDMSFFKSPSTSSVLDSSPLRRPLRLRNGEEGSPLRNTSLSSINNTSIGESRSPSSTMSVGEFPLISLVSSLHEAVSPKAHRLQPSPVRIRIKPIQPTEQTNEPVVDPVVSVLKQIAGNKRVLAPTNVGVEEEQKEKRSRSMPRHDLTHSLLESQLTINASREPSGSGAKREREESLHVGSSPCGVPNASAPKRICARTLRSNEILSSLSSSAALISPPANKSYTGKRKNVSFDKYTKVRKITEASKEVKSPTSSPVKVDKGVTAHTEVEKTPLPVITIKRDEVSERVVSRAMVSALLKSTVAKLIMSGDPAVYPVPNGNQSRQPEVTPPEFGPPKTTSSLSTGITPSLSTGISLPASNTVATSLNFNMTDSLKTSVPVLPTQSPPTFNFGLQQTSATATSTVNTPSISIPSSSSTPAQPLFSLSKPQVSTTAVPSFGLGSSGVSTASTTALPQVTTIATSSVTSLALPSFGIPTMTSTSTIATPVASGTPAPPSFSLKPATSNSNPPIPTFGVISSATTSTSLPTSSFVFGSTSSGETKTTTSNAPPSFASVASSSTIPTFGLSSTTAPTSIAPSNLFSSNLKPVSSPNTPKFGESSITPTPLFGATASTTATPTFGTVSSTPSLPVSTSSSLFSTTTNATPVFGTNLSSVQGTTPTTTSSNIFGTSTSLFGGTTTTAPVFGVGSSTTTSAPIFGANATPSSSNLFGGLTTSAPVFGSTTVTTASSLFGGSTVATTTTASLFGGFTSTTTAAATPIFGASTTSTPLFSAGVPATTASSLFGGTTTAPIFGGSSTTAPVFGSTTTTTAAPVFGGSNSLTTTSTPLFGGNTATTSQTSLFGTGTATFSSSGFGGSSMTKSEGLFGMPSSNSGFKASSPFQVGGTDANNTSGFGSSSGANQSKAFEFGSSKPSSGGFTFKPSGGTVNQFAAQPQPSQTPAPNFSQQPQTQQPQQSTSFNFSGGSSTTAPPTASGSPFVFGTPQAQPAAAPSPGGKPFQFGPTPSGPSGFGAFTPTFGGTGGTPAPNLSFGTPTTPNSGFQFNSAQPATPGPTGLFSIGTGSTGSRTRDRTRERRRKV